jgi:hypothetical protein
LLAGLNLSGGTNPTEAKFEIAALSELLNSAFFSGVGLISSKTETTQSPQAIWRITQELQSMIIEKD